MPRGAKYVASNMWRPLSGVVTQLGAVGNQLSLTVQSGKVSLNDSRYHQATDSRTALTVTSVVTGSDRPVLAQITVVHRLLTP